MSDQHNPSPAALLALYEAASRHLKAKADEIRPEVQAAMAAGEIKTLNPRDAHREILATISSSDGSLRVVIADEAAFLDFVKQHHPTEIVEVVRPAFVERVKDEIKKFGNYPDPDGVPQTWFRFEMGKAYITVKPTAETTQRVATMIDGGMLKEIEA